MVFLIDFNANKQTVPAGYTLRINRTGDDGLTKSAKYDLDKVNGTIRFTTSTKGPGFVRILAMIFDAKGKRVGKAQQTFDGGAGVNIDKLKPAAEEPADYDAFWDKQKKRLDAVPVKAERKLISKPNAPVLVYAVKIDCAGPRPVTGYLTIPANAKAKSIAAQVNYQGYGTHVQTVPKTGPKNKIHLTINAHGYDLGKDKAYYKDFFEKIKSNGKGYAFDSKQNSDREAAYFNGMALRVMRSLQYVKSLPEWNGKTLIVAGGSQGGLQTMWAAALDKDVTAAHPGVTWCCDLAGHSKLKRLNGWRPAYVPALDYYDPVFHARRVKCKVIITRAGLGDYVCPPSGLAICYNELKCPKLINWVQSSTHGYVQKGTQKFTITPNK
jgi:cephalosporin-C deacetylase-like acetyl esterase